MHPSNRPHALAAGRLPAHEPLSYDAFLKASASALANVNPNQPSTHPESLLWLLSLLKKKVKEEIQTESIQWMIQKMLNENKLRRNIDNMDKAGEFQGNELFSKEQYMHLAGLATFPQLWDITIIPYCVTFFQLVQSEVFNSRLLKLYDMTTVATLTKMQEGSKKKVVDAALDSEHLSERVLVDNESEDRSKVMNLNKTFPSQPAFEITHKFYSGRREVFKFRRALEEHDIWEKVTLSYENFVETFDLVMRATDPADRGSFSILCSRLQLLKSNVEEELDREEIKSKITRSLSSMDIYKSHVEKIFSATPSQEHRKLLTSLQILCHLGHAGDIQVPHCKVFLQLVENEGFRNDTLKLCDKNLVILLDAVRQMRNLPEMVNMDGNSGYYKEFKKALDHVRTILDDHGHTMLDRALVTTEGENRRREAAEACNNLEKAYPSDRHRAFGTFKDTIWRTSRCYSIWQDIYYVHRAYTEVENVL